MVTAELAMQLQRSAKNRLTNTTVIVENKVARFYGSRYILSVSVMSRFARLLYLMDVVDSLTTRSSVLEIVATYRLGTHRVPARAASATKCAFVSTSI